MFISGLRRRTKYRFFCVKIDLKYQSGPLTNLFIPSFQLFSNSHLLNVGRKRDLNPDFSPVQCIRPDENMNESLENANSCSFPMAHGIPLIAINVIICVLGSLGNLLVCLAIATNSRLRRASNYLLFSLAIADLIVTLVCEPLLLKIIIQRTFFYECTEWLQRTYSLLSQISCSTSVYHMVAISFDRFVAVVFPLRHRNFIEGCGLKFMLIISWSIPILGRVLRAIVPPASYPGHFFGLGVFALSYFFIFFFYFLIVVFLIHYRRKRKHLGARTLPVKVTSSREVRVACTLAIAIGVFTVCWVPLMTVFFAAGKLIINRNGSLLMWLRTLALSNSAMNFLIYSAKIRDFKEAYVYIFRKMLRL